MVLLTITPAAKAALSEYFTRLQDVDEGYSDEAKERREKLSTAEIGSPVEHHELVEVSRFLVQNVQGAAQEWSLDTLLKGANVYQPPPPPKPEPSDGYKRLMKRLREEEEQRQYERMINPAVRPETFSQRFPNATTSFGPMASPIAEEIDEVTYADVNRQLVLIINVLVSIICTSVAVWMAARRWSVPQRMALAFFSSTLVAVAEVVIYMGYIRRIKEAKTKERKKVEKKEILDTWVIDAKSSAQQTAGSDSMRMGTKDFHHPFRPYDIQQQFMECVYNCIEHGNVGIFESPTGTGKSLSLICGSLTWLREHKRKLYDEAMANVDVEDGEPEWMTEAARNARSREIRHMREEFEARLEAVREKERRARERAQRIANDGPAYKRQKKSDDQHEENGDDEQFVLADYDSGDEIAPDQPQYSTESTKLMEKLGLLQKSANPDDNAQDTNELKIYFCSRTHSQLSQFIGELQRVRLPPGLPPEAKQDKMGNAGSVEELKHLTLGSRQNLCINPRVNKLPTQTAINERCAELQQSNVAADKKCQYLPKKENEDIILDFRDHALAKIRDIEDLASLGSKLSVCPYYASRPGIGHAEIVTLPYPLLLHKAAREALDISIKGHVIIIDEAHNLMDSVESIHSASIGEQQLQQAKAGLAEYYRKFNKRLKDKNRMYVTQLIKVINSLLHFASQARQQSNDGDTTTATSLLARHNADQINLAKLVQYITASKLARKVEGYIAHLARAEAESKPKSTQQAAADVPTLTHAQNFLPCLMNPAKEGRFTWNKIDDKVTIKYMLLDPAEHFREIVEDARSVILAGGTMSPMEDYKQQLFPYLKDITTFSCGHLIPPSNLFVRTITSDIEGAIDFTFKSRDKNMLRAGKALLQLAPKVQGGMVVFFPSYSYIDTVLRAWKTAGITSHLETLKPLFFDTRGTSQDDPFSAYTAAIHKDPRRGALLLSVIGGKLSEGINFSNELGRCVVLVGLPFPNYADPDWKAKMEYLEERATRRGEPKGRASREHGENVTMRSVNQAIGRAIRHKDDWASILLFDARYADERFRRKLPGWIRDCVDAKADGSVGSVCFNELWTEPRIFELCMLTLDEVEARRRKFHCEIDDGSRDVRI
ncbi:ATP-dependent RNA helicase chl1 [Cercospora zeina]